LLLLEFEMRHIFILLMLIADTAADHPILYAALKRPEWWLVIAALLTLYVINKQAREMARATEEMKKSTAAVEKQAGILERLVDDMSTRRILMVFTPEHPQAREFTWMDWAYAMRFSADGKQILFGDQHSGDLYGTFLRNLDGSPAVRLGDGDPMDLSADGKWVISRLPSSPDQFLLLPTGAGEPRQITHSKLEHLTARWLPDGRIFCTCNEAGHPERTYLIDTSGNETPLTPEGIIAIAATSDGKRLLVSDVATTKFQLFPLDGGSPQSLPQLQSGDAPIDFTSDDSAILLRRPGRDGAMEIWRVELPGGKRTLLRTFTLPEGPALANGLSATVSRDGKSYAYEYHPVVSTEYVVEGLD
jgi:eukaryotic-like serine/threonine-protein kinase